jgi:hypothetical protein
MNALDLFFKRYSYKFPKGYPDMNDEQDKALLFQLLEGLNITEGNSPVYEKLISDTFNGKIPAVKGSYSIPENGGKLTLESADKEPFNKLFKIKPDAGVGNGEISLYWLFNYANPASPANRAEENRGGSAADLKIDGKEVEVKSYPSHSAKINLGKFKDDTESRKLITRLFGVLNLTSAFEGKKEFVSEVSFNTEDLKKSFEQVIDTKKILSKEDVKSVLGGYEIFQQLESQIDSLLALVPNGTAEELAKATMAVLVSNKLSLKPGAGNYVVNIIPSDSSDIMFHKVPEDIKGTILAQPYEKVAKTTGVSSAEIQVSYSLFE